MTGASHLAQYTGLMSPKIGARARYVLDNAPAKHGKRLYGTELIAQPFDIVMRFQAPIVVVPPSPYVVEMIEQIRQLNSGAQIIR